MPQENVELVRRMWDLFNRREIERALDLTHENFEMDWSNSIGPLKGIYQGRRQVLELWRSFVEAWDELRWEPDEIIVLDTTRVIVVNRVRIAAVAAASRSRQPAPKSGRSATASSSARSFISRRPRPSKQWGCRSNREQSISDYGRATEPAAPSSAHTCPRRRGYRASRLGPSR